MRAIVLSLIVLLSTTTAYAGDFVEGYRLLQSEATSVDTVDAYMARRFEGSGWGLSAFFLVTEGWGEGYVGPTYAPIDWLEVSLSIGGEQTPDGLGMRYAASIWTGTGPWSALTIVEFNNDVLSGDDLGLWYDFTGTYRLADWLLLGLRDRRFVGAGPHVMTPLPNIPLSLWGTWTPFDPEGLTKTDPTRLLLGTQLSL